MGVAAFAGTGCDPTADARTDPRHSGDTCGGAALVPAGKPARRYAFGPEGSWAPVGTTGAPRTPARIGRARGRNLHTAPPGRSCAGAAFAHRSNRPANGRPPDRVLRRFAASRRSRGTNQ